MRSNISHYLPELDEPERSLVERATLGMSESNVQQFAMAYRARRKDPKTVLLLVVIGVVAIPGLHRFALGHIGMGFLYLFTYGLLLLGTIMDIVKHKDLAFNYNRQIARSIASNLRRSANSSVTRYDFQPNSQHSTQPLV